MFKVGKLSCNGVVLNGFHCFNFCLHLKFVTIVCVMQVCFLIRQNEERLHWSVWKHLRVVLLHMTEGREWWSQMLWELCALSQAERFVTKNMMLGKWEAFIRFRNLRRHLWLQQVLPTLFDIHETKFCLRCPRIFFCFLKSIVHNCVCSYVHT